MCSAQSTVVESALLWVVTTALMSFRAVHSWTGSCR